MTDQPTDIGSLESWSEAKKIGSLIGDVPSSFSTCVRALRADVESKSSDLGPIARFSLGRLLRSHSFAAPVYYAALTFRSEEMQAAGGLSVASIRAIFRADEIPIIVALIYLFRRIRKGCDPTEWKLLEQQCIVEGDLGGYIGVAIPTMGLSTGLICGLLRNIALGMFLGIDKDGFQKYQKLLKKSPLPYNIEYETKTWGCSHLQIASVLAQAVGLGIPLGQTIVQGLSEHPPKDASQEVLALQVCSIWIRELLKTGRPPQISHRVEFYPHTKDLELLLSRVETLRAQGSVLSWLTRGRADVSPEKTPGLFRKDAILSPAPQEVPQEGIPEELLKDDLSAIEE